MNRLSVVIDNISLVLDYYDQVKVYRATSEGGGYAEITDVDTRIDIIAEKRVYYYPDADGLATHWYKTSYYNSTTTDEGELSSARQGGTEEEKIGYTFNNYSPPSDEWGKLYTSDDMRYTMLFGIDTVAADIARSEWQDEQFNQQVLEALYEFERYLTIDIRKKVYKTNPASTLVRSRLWREGVDYTDEEDQYPYDYIEWSNTGFLQLRHSPIISVERAIWKNLVDGTIMDLIENNWMRINKKMGQLNFYPKGGFPYGPYSVYGPIWTTARGGRYPQGFEIDYTAGYVTSDFVPEDLRGVIAMYATIKSLGVIGDGLLAGFSSQSISLDGLSESFSSTQSATSIGPNSITEFGRIEDVYNQRKDFIGKELGTINVNTELYEYKRLLDVIRHKVGNKKCYRIETITGHIIVITEDHSLFTKDFKEIRGGAIKKGMYLRMQIGTATVVKVDLVESLEYVYDLSVEDNENFIANGFLCHNSAYFGARIKSYSDQITEWLKRSRYKYAPIPMSWVGV